MDYSKFVYAIQSDDEPVINEMVPIIMSVLIKFLKVRQGAGHHDAEDCAQNTLIQATEKIKTDQIENPNSVIYYLFTTAKNEYFKLLKKDRESNYEEIPESYAADGEQLFNLLEAEKQRVLALCMKLLKPDLKEYIQHWFSNPRDDASVVADHFGISVNNAWTKKHRVLKLLKECCEKKLDQ